MINRITFLAAFLSFFCFAAEAFPILCLSRTGVRFDFGSEKVLEIYDLMGTV